MSLVLLQRWSVHHLFCISCWTSVVANYSLIVRVWIKALSLRAWGSRYLQKFVLMFICQMGKRNSNMHISEDPTTVIKLWEGKDKKAWSASVKLSSSSNMFLKKTVYFSLKTNEQNKRPLLLNSSSSWSFLFPKWITYKIPIPCSPCLVIIILCELKGSWAIRLFFWTWGSWCFQNFSLVLMCRVETSPLVGITPGNQCLRGLGVDCFVSTKHSSSSESPCLLIFSVMIFIV